MWRKDGGRAGGMDVGREGKKKGVRGVEWREGEREGEGVRGGSEGMDGGRGRAKGGMRDATEGGKLTRMEEG